MNIYEAYRDCVEGARVVLVGGADNFSYRDIFPADVVVTVNDHCIRQQITPDVIYHVIRGPDLFNALIRLLETPPRFFWGSIRDDPYESGFSEDRQVDEFVREWHKPPEHWVGHFAAGEWDGPNPYGEEYEWLNTIHAKYNCKLLTGLVALADILRYGPAELLVVGMDMYVNEPQRGRPNYRDSHFLPGNYAFLRDIMNRPNVILDTPLREQVEKWYEDSSEETNA